MGSNPFLNLDFEFDITEAGEEDLAATVSGLFDRYLSYLKNAPFAGDVSAVTQAAAMMLLSDVAREACRRLIAQDLPAAERVGQIHSMAEGIAALAGYQLHTMPHLVKIVASGALTSAVRRGLTAPTTPPSKVKRS